ncbi:hypothetical protein BDQ17DRAFT_1430048 [Cyathus striatus]|nr:hypothetical protein BDQ17DRAFT_1430048 [Cyathus striatus]
MERLQVPPSTEENLGYLTPLHTPTMPNSSQHSTVTLPSIDSFGCLSSPGFDWSQSPPPQHAPTHCYKPYSPFSLSPHTQEGYHVYLGKENMTAAQVGYIRQRIKKGLPMPFGSSTPYSGQTQDMCILLSPAMDPGSPTHANVQDHPPVMSISVPLIPEVPPIGLASKSKKVATATRAKLASKAQTKEPEKSKHGCPKGTGAGGKSSAQNWRTGGMSDDKVMKLTEQQQQAAVLKTAIPCPDPPCGEEPSVINISNAKQHLLQNMTS